MISPADYKAIEMFQDLETMFRDPPRGSRFFTRWAGERTKRLELFDQHWPVLERLGQRVADCTEVSVTACSFLHNVQICIVEMRPDDGSYLPTRTMSQLYQLKVDLLTLILMMKQQDVVWEVGFPNDGDQRGLTVSLFCTRVWKHERYWHWPIRLIPERVKHRIREVQGEYPPRTRLEWNFAVNSR